MNQMKYVLGLDVGVASLGWAAVKQDAKDSPTGILGMGSLIFEAGTEGSMADIEKGQDTPKNAARRMARQLRRGTWRKAKRKRKLLRRLMESGLLPPMEAGQSILSPTDIDKYIKSLDRAFESKWGTDHQSRQNWPYLMRRNAVGEGKLELSEIGRALYHLAQRRGFLSNRKTDSKDTKAAGPEGEGKKPKEAGEIEKETKELQEQIDSMATGPKTLGSYLSTLNPDEQRLRGRWTTRAMYKHEFDAMWDAQAPHYPQVMTQEAKKTVHDAIFHQRPLKDQSHLIGKCSLEPKERRAPVCVRIYQRFRVLQTVNAIELNDPDGGVVRLSEEQRRDLTAKLMSDASASFTAVKKILDVKKNVKLNFEEGKDKGLVGNRTDSKLRAAIGDRFDELTEIERDEMVHQLRSFRSNEALEVALKRRWSLTEEQARLAAGISLEQARGSLSLKAIRKLMPHLEKGLTYGEARKAVYQDSFRAQKAHDSLPMVQGALKDLKNPSVARALTQVRKVVNQLIAKYGKPEYIQVELARELKNPRGVRERITENMREREKYRDKVKEKVIKDGGVPHPSKQDIEKARLFDECGGICPYTGKPIDFKSMFGKHPTVHVEHIWPRSRCLDDSLLNKTLCYGDENVNRKRGRTPFETYGGGSARDLDRYNEILDRVMKFRGDVFTRKEKFRRFAATEIDPGFENRHLSDTRYIARACADYLALLYGGRSDIEGTKRIGTPTGGLTAWLRSGWGLSKLLGDTGEKNRSDHRHHAIDALVIAVSDERAVQILSRAAAQAEKLGKVRAFEEIDRPWDSFEDEARTHIESMIVAHRQSRKVRGALHTATLYSKEVKTKDGREVRVRRELQKLSPNEIVGDQIVDERARRLIREKLASLGITEPDAKTIKQVFSNEENWPLIKGAGGQMVRLRKVRVCVRENPTQVGPPGNLKNVTTEGNHHVCLFERTDGNKLEWRDHVVTLFDAVRRLRDHGNAAIVNREPPKEWEGTWKFKFSLAIGEFVEIDGVKDWEGQRVVMRVGSISDGDIQFRYDEDARIRPDVFKDHPKRGTRITSMKQFATRNAKKCFVSYLGEVRAAND